MTVSYRLLDLRFLPLSWDGPEVDRNREQQITLSEIDDMTGVVLATNLVRQQVASQTPEFVAVEITHGVTEPSGRSRRPRIEPVTPELVEDARVVRVSLTQRNTDGREPWLPSGGRAHGSRASCRPHLGRPSQPTKRSNHAARRQDATGH